MFQNQTINQLENELEKGPEKGVADPLLVSRGSLPPFSNQQTARNRRYSLLCELSAAVWKRLLPVHEVRNCSRHPIPAMTRKKTGELVSTGMPGHIEIHTRTEGQHNYHGLRRCASALVCPFCSAILQVKRSREVMQMGEYMLAHGFQVALITQTASHDRNTNLVDFVKLFQKAQREMKRNKGYRTWQKETGAKFTIKVNETTDDNFDIGGRKSGWHFHSHTIVFFERNTAFTAEEASTYTKIFQMLWVKALEKVGLNGSLERAARVDLPRANDKLDTAREEGDLQNIRTLCAYVAKAFGWEVAGTRNKKGRADGRRVSVWELQEAALTDRPDLLPRYGEYMRAIKGVNWIRCSPGLKDFCGLDEKTDQALLEEGTAGEECIYIFTNQDFRLVWRHGAQGLILDAADEGGAAGIAALVAKLNSTPEV